MRILIADDDPVTRRLLQASLTHAGHEVVEVADGQSAWELLQREPVRFVITDRVMPGMDGPELIRRIRAASLPSDVYIVLLAEKGAADEGLMTPGRGADDCLTKPFALDELQARVALGQRIMELATQLRDAQDRLLLLAFHDSLTGLLNRRAIYEHAEAELSRARREAESMSLVLLDIDHFKAVNDRHGHLVGDEALCLIADIIIDNIRPYDWAGRWGGEEFLLVLPGARLPEAVAVGERVRAKVAATPLTLPDGGCLRLQVSLGAASMSPDTFVSLDTLLQQADEALYRAKREGRNQVYLLTSV